jgi:hypothetical protein
MGKWPAIRACIIDAGFGALITFAIIEAAILWDVRSLQLIALAILVAVYLAKRLWQRR